MFDCLCVCEEVRMRKDDELSDVVARNEIIVLFFKWNMLNCKLLV